MSVVFFGDWHGNTHFAVEALRHTQADYLVHVGDFGFWPARGRSGSGWKYLDRINRLLDQPLYIVPGNHEFWPGLRIGAGPYSFTGYDDDGFMVSAEYPMLRVVDRVNTWAWDGVSFGALAGAASIDRRFRREGVSWWPEEMPTLEHVESLVLLADGVDVLVTHDAPTSAIEAGNLYGGPSGWSAEDLAYAHESSRVIESARQLLRPTVQVCGHHHVRRTVVVDGTRIEFLADDSSCPLEDNRLVFGAEELL